jgi:hypothetical protein
MKVIMKIGNMKVERITCPHCTAILTPEIISQFVDRTTFDKYKVFVRNL